MPDTTTTDPSSTPGDFELFGPGGCDKQLPTNEVVEEYTFGQFIRLRYGVRPVTGVLPGDDTRSFLAMIGASALKRAVSVHGVVSRKPEPLPHDGGAEMMQRVEVDNIDRLVAERTVRIGSNRAPVELDSVLLRRLLAGYPVETVSQQRGRSVPVRLIPPAPEHPVATQPAVREHTVRDLAAFLMRPAVPGMGGAPYPLPLTTAAVRQLRRDGVVTIGSGNRQVTVKVDSPPTVAFAGMEGNFDWDVDDTGVDTEPPVIEPPVIGGTYMPPDVGSGYIAPETSTPELPTPPRQSPDAFTVGLYLPWTQSWRLKGYSRGALVHSLTLAPQEETTIELFTWDRRKRSLEQSASFEGDQSIEQTDTTKDVMDVVRELATSNEFKIEGHAQLKVSFPSVETQLGGSLDDTSKLNETARRTINHLHESTQKAAARVRVSRQTRISEASETGREERVTRKIRNANMCRTLTLNYFEVLAHYMVTTAFDQKNAQVCLFVPFPIELRSKIFTDRDLRINERALRGALINPELADGFVAARTLYARSWAMQHVCDAPKCQHDEGAPGPGGGTISPSRNALENAVRRVVSASRTLRNASILSFADSVIRQQRTPSATEALAVQRWGFWKLLSQSYGTVRDGLDRLAAAGTPMPLAPGVTIPPISMDDQIATLGQLLDVTLPATLQMIDTGQPQDALKRLLIPEFTALAQAMPLYIPFQMIGVNACMSNVDQMNCADPEDAGLVSALANFKKEFDAFQKALGDAGGGDADLLTLREAQRQAHIDAEADQVQSAFPLGDTAAAAERMDALLAHLNAHQSHYRFALLQAMPIGDQMHELALVGLPTDLVEPRILGMVDGGASGIDLLAVPINTALEPSWKKPRDLFIDKNPELVNLTSSREVRMPTPGVSIEARLGECDACEEFIMESRGIELDQRRVQVRAQRAAARQAEQEAERFEARIEAGTLDDPTPEPGGIHVTLEKPVP